MYSHHRDAHKHMRRGGGEATALSEGGATPEMEHQVFSKLSVQHIQSKSRVLLLEKLLYSPQKKRLYFSFLCLHISILAFFHTTEFTFFFLHKLGSPLFNESPLMAPTHQSPQQRERLLKYCRASQSAYTKTIKANR